MKLSGTDKESRAMDVDNLDAILEEVKGYNIEVDGSAEDSSHKDWSLDDIDALIAGLDLPAANREEQPEDEEKPAEEPQAPVEEYSAKQPIVFPDEDVPVSSYFRMDAKPVQPVIETEKPGPEKPAEEVFFEETLPETEIDKMIADALGDFYPFAQAQPETVQPDEAPAPETQEKSGETVRVQTVQAPEEPAGQAKPKGEIREFSIAKASAKKLSNFVINDAPEPEKQAEPEPEPDPDKIPDYDPLADYEARKKESEQPGMVTDKTRESFINPLVLEDVHEEENDIFEPYDKPGILFRKGEKSPVSGLEALPTVISADKANAREKTIIAGAKKQQEAKTPAEEEFPGQIKLVGFEEIPEESMPENIAEEELESSLFESRRHKAKEFRIESGVGDTKKTKIPLDEIPLNEIPTETIPGSESAPENKHKHKKAPEKAKPEFDEYKEPGDRRRVHASLNEAAVGCAKRILAYLFIEVVLLVFNIVAYFSDSSLFCQGGGGNYIANAVLLIAAMVTGSSVLSRGLRALKAKAPDSASAALLVSAVAFVHLTAAAAVELKANGSTPAFSMLGVAAIAAVDFAKYIDLKRILHNFVLCAYKYEKKLFGIHPFEDETEVRELSRSIMLDKAGIFYSSKTDFPADFIKNSTGSEAELKAAKKIIPVSAAAAVIVGIISAIVRKDALDAFTAACAAFCVCSPIFASLAPAAALRSANACVNKDGAAVIGLDSSSEFAGVNAIVIDSGDIFNRSKCRLHGMVDFKNIRVDDLLIYAAALVIKSNGPLRESFEDAISEDYNLLPQVRDLAYEDKLGVSARIHMQKVLLGSRALLENHGVAVPDKSLEEKHSRSGKKVLYLAVCGKLAAMFVVSYAVDKKLKPLIEQLEANGTQVLVRSNDVNVTEDMLSRGFGIPKEEFRVLGSVAGRLFTRRRDEVSERESIKLAHDGKAFSMLRAVCAAQKLAKNKDFLFALQLALCALGFILSAFLSGTAGGFGAVSSFLFTAACAGISYAVSYFTGANK